MSRELELAGHLKKKRLLGVEIFSTGTFEPSTGPTREWNANDLDGIIAAFDAGIPEAVHVKLGHTSPEFAQLIAEQLGVPLEVVKGEDPGGDGQISLGRIVKLERRQNKLVADMDVPEPVADIVAKGFSTVSVELLSDFNGHPWVLSAVALLGAERPAVKDLAALAEGAALSDRKPQLVHAFKVKDSHIVMAESDSAWDKIKAYVESLMGKAGHQEGEMKETDIAKALKMAEHATPEEVMAEINALRQSMDSLVEMLGLDETATPDDVEEAAKEQLKDAAALKAKAGDGDKSLKAAEARILILEGKDRLSHFKELVRDLTAVEGTLDELAGKLVAMEIAQDEKAALERLEEWKKTQEFAEGSGILKRIGSSREATEGTFMAEVAKHQAANKDISVADAIKFVQKDKPDLWAAHRDSTVGAS